MRRGDVAKELELKRDRSNAMMKARRRYAREMQSSREKKKNVPDKDYGPHFQQPVAS